MLVVSWSWVRSHKIIRGDASLLTWPLLQLTSQTAFKWAGRSHIAQMPLVWHTGRHLKYGGSWTSHTSFTHVKLKRVFCDEIVAVPTTHWKLTCGLSVRLYGRWLRAILLSRTSRTQANWVTGGSHSLNPNFTHDPSMISSNYVLNLVHHDQIPTNCLT